MQSRFDRSPPAMRLALTQRTHHEHRRYIVIHDAITGSVFPMPPLREDAVVRFASSFACPFQHSGYHTITTMRVRLSKGARVHAISIEALT